MKNKEMFDKLLKKYSINIAFNFILLNLWFFKFIYNLTVFISI